MSIVKFREFLDELKLTDMQQTDRRADFKGDQGPGRLPD